MSTTARASKPASKRPGRPRDINQLAARLVAEATAERAPQLTHEARSAASKPAPKNAAAVALGKLGGRASAKVRGEKISPERRAEIAKKAAAARWAKPTD